jgi:regulatory protein
VPTKRTGNDVITKISLKKKGKATLHFASAKKITLSENAFTDFHLYEGKEVTPLEMRELLDAASLDDLLAYAMRLLTHEAYSEHDLRKKLWDKGADLEQSRKILFKLKKQGLIDDTLFAKSFADDLADLRLYGKRRVVYELHKRGIPNAIIESLSFPREKELDKAKRYVALLDKKNSRIPNAHKKQKSEEALMIRGFDEDVANEACRFLTPNDPKAELQRLERDYAAAKTRYSRKYTGYDLSRRIFAYLIAKGYRYDDIHHLQEKEKL